MAIVTYPNLFELVKHPSLDKEVHALVVGFLVDHPASWREAITNALEAEFLAKGESAVEVGKKIRFALTVGDQLSAELTEKRAKDPASVAGFLELRVALDF